MAQQAYPLQYGVMCGLTSRSSLILSILVLFGLIGVPGHSILAQVQHPTGTQTNPSDQPAQTAPAADQSLPDDPGAAAHVPTGPTAMLDTSMGRITCGLFSKEAP